MSKLNKQNIPQPSLPLQPQKTLTDDQFKQLALWIVQGQMMAAYNTDYMRQHTERLLKESKEIAMRIINA